MALSIWTMPVVGVNRFEKFSYRFYQFEPDFTGVDWFGTDRRYGVVLFGSDRFNYRL